MRSAFGSLLTYHVPRSFRVGIIKGGWQHSHGREAPLATDPPVHRLPFRPRDLAHGAIVVAWVTRGSISALDGNSCATGEWFA